MAVDYAALAKQYGGTSSPAPAAPSSTGSVDYAALAKQFGGTSQPASNPQQTAPAQSPDLLTRAGGVASKALSFTGGNSIAQSIGTLGGYLYTKAKDKL